MSSTDSGTGAVGAIAGKRHEAIASVLRGRILDGGWSANHRLPSLDSLAREFSVSSITVRQALASLESEGLVMRRQGVGTFVSKAVAARRNLLMRFATCWGPIVETGGRVDLKMLESETHPRPRLLGSDGETATAAPSYRYLRRLSLEGGRPFSMLEAEIDTSLYRRATRAFETRRALLEVLDEIPDLRVSQARQYLTIEVADIDQAALLDVPLGSPVGRIKRVVVDAEGVAVAIVAITYPGALVKLEMSLSNAIG